MSLTRAQICSIIDSLSQQSLAGLNASTNRKIGLKSLGQLISFANAVLPPVAPLKLPPSVQAGIDLYVEIETLCPGMIPPIPPQAAAALEAINLLQRVIAATSSEASLKQLASNSLDRLASLDDRLGTLINLVRAVSKTNISAVLGAIPGPAGSIAQAASQNLAKELLAVGGALIASSLNVNQLALARCAGRLCNSEVVSKSLTTTSTAVRNVLR